MKFTQPLVLAATLLASGAAFSAQPAQYSNYDYPPANAATTQASGVPAVRSTDTHARDWNVEGRPEFRSYQGPQASRSTVVNDLQEWKSSGLARLRQSVEPQYATPGYQQALEQRHPGSGAE